MAKKAKRTSEKKSPAKKSPEQKPTAPVAVKPATPAKATEIRLLAGKVLRDGPDGPVYGQPGEVVQVPAECHADRARVLLEAGFAELV